MEPEQNRISPFCSFYLTQEKTHQIVVPADMHFTVSNLSLNCFNGTTEISKSPTRIFAKYIQCENSSNSSSPESTFKEISLGTLIPIKTEHLTTNFLFYPGENIEFSVRGPHQIDIIGYFSLPDESDKESEDSEIVKQFKAFIDNTDNEEEEEEEDLIDTTGLENENKSHE